MHRSTSASAWALVLITTVLALAGFAPAANAQIQPHAGMLQYPDVSASHIVFLYANDLWLVSREGGVATPLASPNGQERYPKFSPDGSSIAFMGNYDGNTDLYTVPARGGVPQRVTHHPVTEVLTDWAVGDRLIYYAGGVHEYPRAQELFTVASTGGLPSKLPIPYGAVGAISPDGRWLAYTPHTRDSRTWKRYRGGMATDIWLFDLEGSASKKITDWEGTDTLPMWASNGQLLYLSDAGSNHRLNIWSYDVSSGEHSQVTSHADYDVKWPSIGPGPGGTGEVVYQYGSELRLLDVASGQANSVEVIIPGARARLRKQTHDVSDMIRSRGISATGQRAVVEARGDIWTIPAENGTPVNLTRSDDVHERYPAWSPDGRWVAYSSDASGESFELWVTQSDGLGEARALTDAARGFLYTPYWSPDSKRIAFWDQTSTLWLYSFEGDSLVRVTKNEGLSTGRVAWSSDSRWMTFTAAPDVRQPSSVQLYNVDTDELQQVTAGMFSDTWPTFDRDGDFLYFASLREVSGPIYEDFGSTWVYASTDRLYAVPLRDDVASPLLPEVDGESWDEDDEEEGDDEGDESDSEDDDSSDEPDPIEIDLEGFERRAIQLPVDRGSFLGLRVNDSGQLVYVRTASSELLGSSSIRLLDLEDDEEPEKVVLASADSFSLTADGKKLLAVDGDRMAIVDASADQKMDTLSTSGMVAHIDPRSEWRQIFHEAWRLERDFFYDPNMHGVDWAAVREQYAALLDDVASRDDLTYIIAEMISELNVGHAYYRPGSREDTPRAGVGMLGAQFTLENGAYRISRILEGAAWDADARGPLSQPGIDVEEGDYLLAINGVPIDTSKDPWAALQHMAGQTVSLTVSNTPDDGPDARQVVVELNGGRRDENRLLYRSWIEANRAYVDEQTGGRVGYIYVPNTGINGQNDLVRQYYGQLTKEALIIDERWNGGGQIPTRFIELLNRPVANYWSLREGGDFVWPYDAHHGPKCMLINGLAGSGGDYFPFWFRETGLGKLVGTRTWGGLVGIGGSPLLIDGTRLTAPNFAFYEKDGTWGIEGHGVDPDIEVVDDPALMVGGKDPQLDAAIELMLEELETRPYQPPTPPAYPDRSGMGLPESDQ